MIATDFIPSAYSQEKREGTVIWKSPSNIALVKYWGKMENQIPANPSISFTLNAAATTTALTYKRKNAPAASFDFDLLFEGEEKPDFHPKIAQFFERIYPYLPFLKQYRFKIESSNSFPHSSGIASSASSMSALALCLVDLERELYPEMDNSYFKRKASFLSRLGSGSACRSIEGPLVQWGLHSRFEGSSDLFGIPHTDVVHPVFENYMDTILLVDKGQKQVSSSVGHQLMEGHAFASSRFEQANANLSRLKDILATGDLSAFINIVENEALTLHAMMMTSIPYFILMKPNTLEIINRIWEFRKSTDIPVGFTLDAGANVHVLYPEKDKKAVYDFIKDALLTYCENGDHLCDAVGQGAKKMADIENRDT